MFGINKAHVHQKTNRSHAEARLRLEALEDRCMPAVAAPLWAATATSGTQINLAWNTVAGASGNDVDEYHATSRMHTFSVARHSHEWDNMARQLLTLARPSSSRPTCKRPTNYAPVHAERSVTSREPRTTSFARVDARVFRVIVKAFDGDRRRAT
jgi:hypothetical protein